MYMNMQIQVTFLNGLLLSLSGPIPKLSKLLNFLLWQKVFHLHLLSSGESAPSGRNNPQETSSVPIQDQRDSTNRKACTLFLCSPVCALFQQQMLLHVFPQVLTFDVHVCAHMPICVMEEFYFVITLSYWKTILGYLDQILILG